MQINKKYDPHTGKKIRQQKLPIRENRCQIYRIKKISHSKNVHRTEGKYNKKK